MKLVIVGCGRSGTSAVHSQLKAAGFKIGHEVLQEDGGIGWPMLMSRLKDIWQPLNPTVLHQVREPWSAISSLTTHKRSLWKAVSKESAGLLEIKNSALRAAMFWINWNKLCMQLTDKFYRVEDLRSSSSEGYYLLTSSLGISKLPKPTKVNSRKHAKLNRNDFVRWPGVIEEIDNMSHLFGYSRIDNYSI